jgi:hypothetical protein
MFTWGSKYLLAVATASFLGAIVYGLASGGGPIGVISLGYRGGVGEHTGYAILTTIGLVAALLGVLNVMIRGGDADVEAATGGSDHSLSVSTPRAPSFWAPLTAFGAACIVVGLAVSTAFWVLGLVVLVVVALEWLVLAWSDQATGDPEVNSVIRTRLLAPLEVPMLALLTIAVIVLGLSRILLAMTTPEASTAVVAIVAALIFGAAVAIAKSSAPRSVISGVVVIGALAVLAGGITAAVVGERDIAHEDPAPADHSTVEGGRGE